MFLFCFGLLVPFACLAPPLLFLLLVKCGKVKPNMLAGFIILQISFVFAHICAYMVYSIEHAFTKPMIAGLLCGSITMLGLLVIVGLMGKSND